MGNFRFPITSGLKVRVEFWKKVYTRYSTSQAVVHDQDHLDVIYEVANLSPKLSHRQRDRSIDRIKRKYKTILRSLARKAKKKNPRFIGGFSFDGLITL